MAQWARRKNEHAVVFARGHHEKVARVTAELTRHRVANLVSLVCRAHVWTPWDLDSTRAVGAPMQRGDKRARRGSVMCGLALCGDRYDDTDDRDEGKQHRSDHQHDVLRNADQLTFADVP